MVRAHICRPADAISSRPPVWRSHRFEALWSALRMLLPDCIFLLVHDRSWCTQHLNQVAPLLARTPVGSLGRPARTAAHSGSVPVTSHGRWVLPTSQFVRHLGPTRHIHIIELPKSLNKRRQVYIQAAQIIKRVQTCLGALGAAQTSLEEVQLAMRSLCHSAPSWHAGGLCCHLSRVAKQRAWV